MVGPTNAEVAAEWRKHAVSPYVWKPSPDQVGVITGEAGGYRVQSDEFPRMAYLKPANPNPDEPVRSRAAREKIASDLAYELHLAVPPALLTTRENPPAGCTANVVVTLYLYPAQWRWSDVRGAAKIEASPLGLAMAAALAQSRAVRFFGVVSGRRSLPPSRIGGHPAPSGHALLIEAPRLKPPAAKPP
jgi:hypothetical protein